MAPPSVPIRSERLPQRGQTCSSWAVYRRWWIIDFSTIKADHVPVLLVVIESTGANLLTKYRIRVIKDTQKTQSEKHPPVSYSWFFFLHGSLRFAWETYGRSDMFTTASAITSLKEIVGLGETPDNRIARFLFKRNKCFPSHARSPTNTWSICFLRVVYLFIVEVRTFPSYYSVCAFS